MASSALAVKEKSKKAFEKSKIKSNEALSWIKNNPKKASLSAFGITCLTGYVNLRLKKIPFWQSVLRSPFNGLYLLHHHRLGNYRPLLFSKNFVKNLDGHIKRSFRRVILPK